MSVTPLLVLAGGFGTRLRTTVSDVPKPLAPVNCRPYLGYLVDSWQQQGMDSMIFLLHHQAEMIEDFLRSVWKTGAQNGCRWQTLVEPRPMGTGGAVAYAVRQLAIQGEFLVANADTWLGTGMGEVMRVESPALATVEVENTERYGKVLARGNKIEFFKEKQDRDPILDKLKESVTDQKVEVFSQGGDGVLCYQGWLCVPGVDDFRQ
jgi:NDP-sugar pyrophosphorylase family protein